MRWPWVSMQRPVSCLLCLSTEKQDSRAGKSPISFREWICLESACLGAWGCSVQDSLYPRLLHAKVKGQGDPGIYFSICCRKLPGWLLHSWLCALPISEEMCRWRWQDWFKHKNVFMQPRLPLTLNESYKITGLTIFWHKKLFILLKGQNW